MAGTIDQNPRHGGSQNTQYYCLGQIVDAEKRSTDCSCGVALWSWDGGQSSRWGFPTRAPAAGFGYLGARGCWEGQGITVGRRPS